MRRRIFGKFYAVLVAATYATIASTSAISPAGHLFSRQSTCPASGYEQCPTSLGLPDLFCCPSGQLCIALAGNTTALCCPSGDCSSIEPIVCDITQQNSTRNPESPLKTTALDQELPRCGAGTCCPFGYTCVDDRECHQDKDQTAPPGASAGAPSSSFPPSPTPTSTPPNRGSSSKASTSAIVGAVVGSLLALILLGALAFFLWRRRRAHPLGEKGPRVRNRPNTASWSNFISNPIVKEGSVIGRSDFVLKSPVSADRSSTLSSRHDHNHPHPAAFASPIHSPDSPAPRIPPIRAMAPQQHSRIADANHRMPAPPTPSAYSIDVFVDARTVSQKNRAQPAQDSRHISHLTTFTEMLESADLGDVRRGGPYVPSSAYSSPRKGGGRG